MNNLFDHMKNEMQRFAPAFIVALLLGCQTRSPNPAMFSAYVYPDSSYLEGSTITVFEELEAIAQPIIVRQDERTSPTPISREKIRDWYTRTHGMTKDEWQESLSDPFHTQKHSSVLFAIISPDVIARDIVEYYRPLLERDGWKQVRKGLKTEITMGSDWIRAYRRDGQLLEIHIMGPWIENREERARAGFPATNIKFRLLGLGPEVLFDDSYELKGKEPFQDNYHRGLARSTNTAKEK